MSVVPLDELGTDAIAVAALAAAAAAQATATGSVPIDQFPSVSGNVTVLTGRPWETNPFVPLATTTAGIIVLGVLP